ncbi:MAG TPA: flagellar export chaperone FliS [Steroidobacteraceae bacterium]
MSGYGRNSGLAAYNSVSVHGDIAGADPHRLVQMLLDAAAQRMLTARGCIERGETVRKAKLLHSCVILIGELRGSLNLAAGGPLAQNLSDLYEYMARQLLLANLNNDIGNITEVLGLLGDIRSAWVGIGPQVRQSARSDERATEHTAAAMVR